MRVALSVALLLVLVGCGSEHTKASQTNAQTVSRTERCTQRFLDRIKSHSGQIRSYVKTAYCGLFARRGWVYADGRLSIKAHLYVLNGYACTSLTLTPNGGPGTKTPCNPRTAMLNPLECAILHYVRRDEVRAYIRKLTRNQKVRCDDGTPLGKLGAA
jgi:hypothetical protein